MRFGWLQGPGIQTAGSMAEQGFGAPGTHDFGSAPVPPGMQADTSTLPGMANRAGEQTGERYLQSAAAGEAIGSYRMDHNKTDHC